MASLNANQIVCFQALRIRVEIVLPLKMDDIIVWQKRRNHYKDSSIKQQSIDQT